MMTFEQFQATRTEVADLSTVQGCEDDMKGRPGLVYLGGLWLERRNDQWPEDSQRRGAYYGLIGNWQDVTDDLEALERRLYDFAVSFGWCDE